MADQKESNTTTSASVKEFITWVANDWQTQTASEAAKTTFGTGTGLAYDGFEKAVTKPTGWVPPFNRGVEEAAKAAKTAGTVMKTIGIGLGVSLDLGEAASLASQGKTDEALCKVVSAAGGVVGGVIGGATPTGPVGAAVVGYGGSKAAEYICRKISDLPTTPQAAPQETSPDYSNYPSETNNETNRVLRMGGKAADAAKKVAAAEAEKKERGNRLLSQSIISAANYTNLSLQQQMEQKVDTSNQSLSEVSRLARAESSASAAKAAADAAAASQAAAAAAQAARDAFRASETTYTNSQGSSSSSWGGWTSGPDQSSAESARLSRSGSTGDPIFIDLDGNGIELYSRNNSPTQFDFDDDGYAETTAWAGPQDGILVIDEGNDNQITQSKEIAFAKWTAAEGDTDLEGLAATFDSNHDGVLDARDQRFGDFKVWKDANSNGVVDAGEMQTLAQAGIKSFNLKVKDGTNISLDDGSVVHGLFDIQRADGTLIQGADVSLAYNDLGYRTRTDAAGNTIVEFESGSALHYRNIGAAEGNANFNLGTDTDATLWVGASGNAGANVLNASSKTTEVLLDGGAGDDNLLGGSGDDILLGGEGADQLQGGAGNDQLFVDGADLTALAALTGTAKSTRINGGDGYDSLVVLDNSQLNLVADDINVESVLAGSANDSITGKNNAVNYVFDGGAGNDALTTAGGEDVLLGGAGNDTLKSGAGDDVLSGGAGTDRLEGGAGNDVYVLNRGDGADRILDYAEDWYKQKYSYQEQVSYSEQYNYFESVYRSDGKDGSWVNELRSGYRTATRMEDRNGYRDVFGEVDGGIDTLQFGLGISVQDLVLSRVGEDMVVALRSSDNENVLSADSVTIEGWADTKNRIENFAFTDGNLLDFSQIVNAQSGMGANDTLNGTADGDFMSGGGGNDTLSGGAGKDILVGGTGDDRLDGGADKDFMFAGAGNDTLIGGDGNDYLIAEAGNDVLEGGDGDDVLVGMDGNDTLRGGAGKDMLLGGAGADLLQGGGGDDTYFYFRGDGKDQIYDNLDHQETYQEQVYVGQVYEDYGKSGNWVNQYRTETRVRTVQDDGGKDSLQFGQGIVLDDLFFAMSGSDLVVGLREEANTLLADMDDQVTIKEWSNAKNRIETFGFADGLTLNMSNIDRVASGYGANDTLTGHAGGDLLSGGAGNDTLNGLAGNDYLIGGAGNDQLNGGDGNDDLFGGAGDDTLDGGEGVDYLIGGSGADTINGGNGNDVITGGAGNDILNGGRGNDVYHFNRGDGQDTINEAALGTETIQQSYTYTEQVLQTQSDGKSSYQVWVNETRTGYRSVLRAVEGGEDTLQFGRNIDISDIMLQRNGTDMVISLLPLTGTEVTDSITIKGWNTPEYRIENLRFINDFAVDIGDIADAKKGTAGNDVLSADANVATWLGGGAGNDTLTGSSAADILHGAAGADTLNGGTGDDVYIFGRGDGKDTLSDSGSAGVGTDKSRPGGDKLLFGTNITMEDLVLQRSGEDMVVYLRDRNNPEGTLSALTDSVTIKNWSNTNNRVEVFQFFDGKDFDVSGITNTYLGQPGADTADTLTGSAGADWMDGFAGNDTLRAGAGKDFVQGGSGNDSIFGEADDDLLSGGLGNDTVYGGTGNDIVVGDAGNDTLFGDEGNDVLAGGKGDDILNGGAGDDFIMGDAGNDTYQASTGFDTYRFGFGDGNDTYIGSEQADINGTDVIQLESGVTKESLWFERVGNDLTMRLLGATDTMTFKNWYYSDDAIKRAQTDTAQRYVYGFEVNGELLTYNKVQTLVNAMNGFTPNDGQSAYGVNAVELPGSVRSAVNSAWVSAA
jgi:Ca2+-binding RTX toxin-like protein